MQPSFSDAKRGLRLSLSPLRCNSWESCFFARIFVLVLVVVLEDERTNNEKTELSRWNFSNQDRSQSLQSTPSRTRTRTIWLRLCRSAAFCSKILLRPSVFPSPETAQSHNCWPGYLKGRILTLDIVSARLWSTPTCPTKPPPDFAPWLTIGGVGSFSEGGSLCRCLERLWTNGEVGLVRHSQFLKANMLTSLRRRKAYKTCPHSLRESVAGWT
jgi:hypothetical protein